MRVLVLLTLMLAVLWLAGCTSAGSIIDRAALNGCDIEEIRAARNMTVVQCYE